MKHLCAATPVAAFFFLSGLGLASPTAWASARIGVDPLQLVLPPRALASSVNVTNDGKQPVTFQVELLAWSQVNGRDVLVPTKDLIVAPPVFRLPVDGRQTVRVGRLVRATPGPVEKTYRLALTEIPPETEAKPDVIATALRVTLPVFLPPASPTPPTFSWQGSPRAGGKGLLLAVTNTGNTTVRIRNLSLERNGTVLASQAMQFPVLPGVTRTVDWTDLPAGLVGDGLELETELTSHRKIVQPLFLGALPATAPTALPQSLVMPVSAAVPAPTTPGFTVPLPTSSRAR